MSYRLRTLHRIYIVANLIGVMSVGLGLSAETNTGPSAARILCQDRIYDFGMVFREYHEIIEHTFVILNIGGTPLKIEKVRACCGATAEIREKTVLPGSNTTLDVRLSVRVRKGEQNKTFFIHSNDPSQPLYSLSLKGIVATAVSVDPPNVSLGQIAGRSESHKKVLITCASGFGFNITNCLVDSDLFDVSWDSVSRFSHHVTIAVLPPLPTGITFAKVHVLTDDNRRPIITIPVHAANPSTVLVVPGEFLFYVGDDDGSQTSGSVVLRSRHLLACNILDVSYPSRSGRIRFHPMGDDGYRCELWDIAQPQDIDGKRVVIHTDHVGATNITIPIRVIPSNID